MKRFRVFGVWAVCLMAAPVAHAQGAQGVFAELFGASTTFGIHYDSRFSSRTRWGGRVGLAYTRSRSQDFFDSNPEATRGWSFPVAVNYLVGRGRHHAEIGVGVSYGLYTCKYHDPAGRQVEHDRSGTFGFLDLGYRYQPARGLMLRTGLNPAAALGRRDPLGRSEHGVDRAAVVYPYLSLGWSF
ncbi:hypothetical protein [Hallella seregens]|uniref:Outer membrane protein beta-barrel domain-containing protein n=1 Tax=Hallella seregens ATCC 51272 TaxID=1336250 RepID=A0ABV5ZM52_9BACT|nr:hypothetical protein [Hallella seregens]